MKLILETIPVKQDNLFLLSHHDKENPCSVLWHYHSQCELVWVPSGEGRRQVGHHFSKFTSGDLVLIGPNVPHLNFNYEARNEFEEVVIQFEKERILSVLALIPEFTKLSIWLRNLKSAVAFGPEIRHRLEGDLRSLLLIPPVERVLLFLKILEALSMADDSFILDAPKKILELKSYEAERMNRIYDYVKNHYQAAIEMKQVVELSGISQEAFCRFFKKMTNMNFTEFVNEFRISKACQMLMEGYPISEVGYANGFNTVSHFNVTFKKLMHLTPTAYRDKFKLAKQ